MSDAAAALQQTSQTLNRERALLRALIDSIPDMIFAKDLQGVYVACNKAFADTLERTVDEIIGRSDFDMFPADVAVEFRERDLEVIRDGALKTHEEVITNRSGDVLQREVVKVPMIGVDGALWGLIGLVRDITERKASEAALAAEHQRLLEILDTAPVAVTLTTDGVVRFANRRATEMLAVDVGVRAPDRFVRPTDRDRLLGMLERDGILRDVEIQLYGPNGDIREVLATWTAAQHEGRNSILAWLVDVSGIKQTEMALRANRQLLESVLENSPAVIYAKRSDGRYTYVNREWERVCNLTRHQVLGKTDFDLFPKEIAEQFRTNDLAVIASGRLADSEERVGTPWGEQIFLSKKVPLLSNIGEVEGLCGISTNITASKRAADELREERERLQTILDTAPVGVAISTEGVVRYANPRTKELIYLAGDSSSSTYVDVQDRDRVAQRLARDGIVRDYEVQMHGPGGEIREILATYLQTEYEGQAGILGWLVDIGRLKAAEDAMRRAKDMAEDAAKAKADFLANMSHEIRTPMNAVIGLAHLCLKTDLSPQQRDYVGKIHNAGISLLGLINDILDFSKIEAGKLDIESSTFELDSVMNSLSTVMAQKVHDKGIELIFDIAPDIPAALIGDPLRLGQVLTNLVGNAVKFTEDGEIRVVGERLEQIGDNVKLRFSVEDSGIGMTKEQSERLFQPFSQADSSTSRKYGGTGLGLAISKRLVEMMDGAIWAESAAGEGSTFTFTAWFGVSDSIRRRVVPARLNALKVLVVDDNASARESLQGLLTNIGANVEQATSGAEAIDAVRRADAGRPFDLLLVDWRMPNLDGIETARRIKTDAALGAQPAIVIVTAFGHEEPHGKAEVAELDGWLVKPVSSSMLVDKLVELFAPEQGGEAAHEPDKPIYDLTGLRILLAEDNKINRQIAVELLEGVGASVETAKNGREALDKLLGEGGDTRFNLVLMDVQMPEMDGFQATAQIRATPRLATLPIIAMTAHAMAEERDRCIAAGMRGHIAKPVDPDLLFRTLREYRPGKGATASTSKPRVTPPRDDAVPDITGFDVAGALRRVAGDVKLYRSLLRQFAKQQAGTDSAIREALVWRDPVTAERLAHTVNGVAGNLGAASLQRIAAELERAIAGRDASAIDAWLPRFAGALAQTVETIHRHLSPEFRPGSGSDPASVAPLLARLRQLLAESDGQSLDAFLEARDRIAGVIPEAELEALQNLVSDFDFEAALDCVSAITRRLNLALE